MCSDSDNTVLGMDRALFDTMRRIYDSESITEDKIKRAVADVSRMSTKPRVDAGLAGCFNELAGRLAACTVYPGLIGWRPSDGGEETRGCKDKDGDRMGCTECKGRGVACPAVGSDVVEVHHEGN